MTRVEAVKIARAARAAKMTPMPQRFWDRVDQRGDNECWEWTHSRNADNYGYFRINGKNTLANRMSWILTNGVIPKGMCVCHRCDKPPCCNPAHLFLGTHLENVADSVKKERNARGSRANSVLTESIVSSLRKRAKIVGIRVASEEFGIKYATARYACNAGWRHV